MSKDWQIQLVAKLPGQLAHFPEIDVVAEANIVFLSTYWGDEDAREHGMSHHEVITLLDKLPWTAQPEWQPMRDAPLRTWAITGIVSLLKHSGKPVSIVGLDMRA